MKNTLEQYYLGDDAWRKFVDVFAEAWGNFGAQDELIRALNGQTDIASVIGAKLRDHALQWIGQPIPALDGLTPIECTKDPTLIRRLRSMLMRMPS